ncbi:MAG: ParB N-terminal domain-containing protein [Planctomycetaceae bacterium]|nr:ParB N-terminal domain-containing protein [Planctomycetaceae bacterium]
MLLRTLPFSSLKPAPYNPRKPLRPGSPGYKRLAKSLAAFDLVQPIVWNARTGHVVAGHQRLSLLKDRGDVEVECVVVDLPLAKEKALNIALNNAAVGSDWDNAKLHELLGELIDLPDFDATMTGFDERELEELVLAPATEMPAVESAPQDAAVRVTLLVAQDQWDDARRALDEMLLRHDIELHVTLPR